MFVKKPGSLVKNRFMMAKLIFLMFGYFGSKNSPLLVKPQNSYNPGPQARVEPSGQCEASMTRENTQSNIKFISISADLSRASSVVESCSHLPESIHPPSTVPAIPANQLGSQPASQEAPRPAGIENGKLSREHPAGPLSCDQVPTSHTTTAPQAEPSQRCFASQRWLTTNGYYFISDICNGALQESRKSSRALFAARKSAISVLR